MCGCEPGWTCTRCFGTRDELWHAENVEDSGFEERTRRNDELSRHTFETPWRSNDT